MKTVHWIAAGLVALASVSAFAAAGGNGGGNGGGSGGAGHGGVGGNAGGMSAGHMSSKGVSNTNGFSSADRDAGLARAAVRNGWPIHANPTTHAQIEQVVACADDSVVIIHIPVADDLALDLIGRIRSSRRRAVVIAVSAAGTEDAEIQARASGAGLFLPASADADLIERTVQALIVPAPRAAGGHATMAAPLSHPRRTCSL